MDKTERMQEIVERYLNEIHAACFVPEVRITFIARLPGDDNADCVLTIDDSRELVKLLRRRFPNAFALEEPPNA